MAERYVCTKEAPWDKTKGDLAIHPDAKCVGECYEGCCDDYECPNCKTAWREEQAQ